MRDERPWGLPAWLLEPDKTVTDPVHQDIYLTVAEARIIDSPSMQRLRHVKQLGMTLKVYPGAEHSRFTHLLGTVAATQKILDKVLSSSDGPHAETSLLTEWRDADAFNCKWGEATVLARLSSLLHDLTHVPFGHTIEDDLEVLIPHDRNEDRFQAMWDQLDEEVRKEIESATSITAAREGREPSLFVELKKIVLDKADKAKTENAKAGDPEPLNSPYPFVADVVNNTICADLLDYIARDHHFLGLPFAVGDRFMDNFYVVPTYVKSEYKERLVVRLVRDGEPWRDVRTELLKFLRYRYEETERALYHKTKLAYDAMLGKMLEMWKDAFWYERCIELYPGYADDSKALDASWLREQVEGLPDEKVKAGGSADEIGAWVESELERHFRFFGDEGLLEHMIWELETKAATAPLDEREQGIYELARRIRYRDHFRLLGQASGSGVLGVAKEKYDKYRTAAARRNLEREAARIAGISPAWQVVLWIPSPAMRLKIAEVLVQEDKLIRPLARGMPSGDDQSPSGDRDAALIVDRHMQLWALRVYAPSELRTDDEEFKRKAKLLLGYLQEELGVPLVRWDGEEVESLARLAAIEIGDERGWSEALRRQAEHQIEDKAAKGEFTVYEDLLDWPDDEEPGEEAGI